MVVLVLLRLRITSNEVCNTAYALQRKHERTPFSKVHNMPNDAKGNEV